MASETKVEESGLSTPRDNESSADSNSKTKAKKQRNNGKTSPSAASAKRRCVSTACIACRKRKSKCDGNTPSCAACSSVYGTQCIYDPNSDHRRKGVYKKDIDSLKTRNSTLQTLIQAILNFPESEVPDLVRQIRTCESLDDVAESIFARDDGLHTDEEEANLAENDVSYGVPQFAKELSGKMGKVKLDNGSVSVIGGTSNLIFVREGADVDNGYCSMDEGPFMALQQEPITSWTDVTSDARLITHLLNMYFTWHYTFFTTLSKDLFWHDFKQGRPPRDAKRKTEYCTSLLVNAMLALGCHFTSWPNARADPEDSATAGDHFFKEAKKLILVNDEHEKPRLTTVQALALMSVREAGCGRESRGWVYSGMSFRMAFDLGINVNSGLTPSEESEIDAQRITMWGCFLFDKCWSNYLGRQPQITLDSITVPKFAVFPNEDSETWRPCLDNGTRQIHVQPARTRAVAIQISLLCEISSDLLLYFYHPHRLEKPPGKQAELKKLSELHTRLEAWRKDLPKEMEPREGQLPNILVMHMFFQLLFIHLFRPFLKYKQAASPLPSHVSPRRFITHSATTISKLLRLYRRTYGLRQICNIAVYIAHTACTVHLLNLPDKAAQRDIQHGLNHLEEIAEGWLCARRTLGILQLVARRWQVDLPEQAAKAFTRTEAKFGSIRSVDHGLEPKLEDTNSIRTSMQSISQQMQPTQHNIPASHPDQHPATHFFPPSGQQPQPSPTSSPSLPSHPQDDLTLPPQCPTDFSRLSRSQHYVVPQTQQPAQQRQLSRPRQQQRPQSTRKSIVTCPNQLFGGVQGLIEDQDWWLRDSNQFFAGWNADPQDANRMAETNGLAARGDGSMGNMGSLNWDMRDYAGSSSIPVASGCVGSREENGGGLGGTRMNGRRLYGAMEQY